MKVVIVGDLRQQQCKSNVAKLDKTLILNRSNERSTEYLLSLPSMSTFSKVLGQPHEAPKLRRVALGIAGRALMIEAISLPKVKRRGG